MKVWYHWVRDVIHNIAYWEDLSKDISAFTFTLYRQFIDERSMEWEERGPTPMKEDTADPW